MREASSPTLLLCAEEDRITPCASQLMFAERIGAEVAVFEGAGHGDGCVHCEAGRRHAMRFLRRHVPVRSWRTEAKATNHMDAQVAAIGLDVATYARRPWRPWERLARFRKTPK